LPFATATEAQAAFRYVPNTWAGAHNGGRLGSRGWALDNYDSRQSGSILTRKALEFIKRATARNATALAPEPFFLFFAPPQLHRPNLSPAFFDVEHTQDDEPATSGVAIAGVSGSVRSDTIREIDVMLGALLDGLEQSGQLDNTLVIFASDNGPFPWPELAGLNTQGLDRGVPLRGYKGQIHEGGHRVPFIAAWGSTLASQIALEPGTRSQALFGLQDLSATFYQLLGLQRPPGQANDSKSLLPLLTGLTTASVREQLIIQGAWEPAYPPKRVERAFYSYDVAGNLWKLISVSSSTDRLAEIVFVELYNLTADPGESSNQINVAASEPLQQQMQAEYLQLLSQPQTIASFESFAD
jgi:arylsulfatase A-like enzyme